MRHTPDVEFMRELESDFVRKCLRGVNDPGCYKIWYSGISPCTVLFLGNNPAGDPSNYLTATLPYTEWGHDFLEYEHDRRYRLANGAMRFLRRLVGTAGNAADEFVRRIPISNVCFIRMQDSRKLDESAHESCRPFVLRMIRCVDPVVIVAMGDCAYTQVERIIKDAQFRENPDRYVRTANGAAPAALYRSYDVVGPPSARVRKVLRVAHLSKFGLGRDSDWAIAYRNLDRDLEDAGLRPFELN